MIYEIYRRIKKALEGMEGSPVRHVGLWNRNIDFLDQEESWERPAVFVEFAPVKWRCVEPGLEYHATPRVMLHIVTDWVDSEEASMDSAEDSSQEEPVEFDLPVRIHGTLCGLSGDCFCGMDIEESQTNHDHGELLESIEIYSCDASRVLG